MCSSNAKVISPGVDISPNTDTQINGRPVLQPTCNRVVPRLERRHSLNLKSPPPPLPPPSTTTNSFFTPPLSPRLKSPRPQATKRASETNGLNSSSDKILIPKISTSSKKNLERNKFSKKITSGDDVHIEAGVFPHSTESSLNYNISSLIVDSPGSIAAVRREQMAILQAQRKMRIAHYGRSKSARFESKVVPLLIDHTSNTLLTKATNTTPDDKKRCTFITHNSDPLYVAYHDEEWGVPVHDDEMLFELLVLSGAQVGSDWTSTLKKRQDFRNAFSGFDAETVANFTEKQITSVSTEYGIDISRVRGVVDNSNQILEIRRIFGSFDKYIWGFVNHKPISTQYKSCLKIPVKTSKSESISKDMVRRGFRFVGPTVLHSFMQAAGLTNDHLITCHRHLQVQQCTAFAS